jgi:hypothetical protein
MNKSKDLNKATWNIVNKAKEIINQNNKDTIKVIETNISLNPNSENDIMLDHQSRIIEVESWDNFVKEIKDAQTVIRKAYIGSMEGNSIPRDAEIQNLKYDDFHLSCDVINWLGHKSKKLVYKII